MLDKKEYLEKAEALLAQPAYRTTDRDPTNKLKNSLIQTLRRIKRDTNMGEDMYRTISTTGCTAPKFYGLPKIHKTGTPSGQLYSVGAQSPMGWLKSLLRYLNP